MYRNILKKDLKRKKTMNVILVLFIILSTMFISSSVNNMLTVTGALDDYFDLLKFVNHAILCVIECATHNKQTATPSAGP